MLQDMPKNTATHTLHTFSSSHKSEYTEMYIIIMKTHYIPNFYQQTYPTYDSMGSSDKDMQWGTTLVFGIDSSEPYESLGKGT